MAEHSTIEWTDATWNPITGCAVVSPGCTNCYAMGLAGTRLKHHPSRAGLTVDTKAGPVWNGQVRLNEAWLTQPLEWKRPRRIFVCAHGDLFAEGVPDAWIDRVFAVMALAPQHTFQVLTKRAARMRAYLNESHGSVLDAWRRIAVPKVRVGRQDGPVPWPLPNVWLGVSAEDQRRADERVPDLLATPAAVRFVSAEPLLGPISFLDMPYTSPPEEGRRGSALDGHEVTGMVGNCIDYVPALDWIIVGGESGPNARPMHPAWARSIRDQCAAAGVAFHFKQHGAWKHMPERAHFKELAREPWRRVTSELLEVRPALMFRVGKKAAGRLLDGVEHNGMPEVRR